MRAELVTPNPPPADVVITMTFAEALTLSAALRGSASWSEPRTITDLRNALAFALADPPFPANPRP